MYCQAVHINRVVRRMRGGSQAYLVEGNDGRFYVAKFAGNPQGNRTLINEWVTAYFLERLGVSTPPLVVLQLDRELSEAAQDLSFQVGARKIPIQPGLHLGSQCPVDPTVKSIYDFLPQRLLAKTSNRADFAKTLAVDVYLGQADSRQAIFVREHSQDSLAFRAYFIDHGMALGGSTWELRDLHSQGVYYDRKIYSTMDTASISESAVKSLVTITEDELYSCLRDVPREWFAPSDNDALKRLFTLLHKRKDRLPLLVLQQLGELVRGHAQTLNGARGAEEVTVTHVLPQSNQQLTAVVPALQ